MELTLETVISPRQYAQRLPLKTRYLVFTDEGWQALDGDRYTVSAEAAADLRFRVEVYTPDGQVEYRQEKVITIQKSVE
jgi:hypothetical protein